MKLKKQNNGVGLPWGCWQGEVKKQNNPPKVQLKNGLDFLYGHKKVDLKYFELEYKTIGPYI
jgi:hypothetical protein